MRKLFRGITMLLIACLAIPALPISTKAADSAPLFDDSFSGGLGNWDLFGSTAWTVQGSGIPAQLIGTTTSTGPQRAVVKPAKLAFTSTDYNLEFAAQGDRFRTIFRYTSGTNYYFLEFKNTNSVELWKFPNSSSSVIVGTPINISTAIPAFNLSDLHQYKVEVKGTEFTLSVDGTLVTVFTDSSLSAGGIGFSLKSQNATTAVNVSVEQVSVTSIVAPPAAYAIAHAPVTQIPYNANLPVSFSVADATYGSTTGSIHYGYGDDELNSVLQATSVGASVYSATIPASSQTNKIRYYITAQNEAGSSDRYPDNGEITVNVGAIEPYLNDFEGSAPNTIPAGWTTGGNTRVVQLPDGNKVFNLNGSGSAKLNLPMYQNADNFVVKFKAKYERTSEAAQNTWRFRYRASDDMNNNAIEWATHNSKYFIMRKTTLGGNYYIANYVKALLDEWHDYELRVSGISHKLLIDGVETTAGDDSDSLAPTKGYFQWNVVGGINLMIDDFSIEPLQSPYVIDLQPMGNYVGIYALGETPGLDLALEAGAQDRMFDMDYVVRRADGAKEIVASGTESYELDAYEKEREVVPFDPALNSVGTYEVSADFSVDGVEQPDKSKIMRLAVVKTAAPVRGLDLDNESKFGLNTHYALNWKDDIIDGARKMGARHHRSGIAWEDVDKNVKDSFGAPVYDYSRVDPQLDKLFSYGFNQITVLGIEKNGNYQPGVPNTTASLEAAGDFVAHTVDKYKDVIRQWEMPNEPEIFSKPYIPSEFVQLQKIAYLNMKKADPNAMLLAGDHTSSVLSVLPRELELGSYDYADAFSYHPYVYNSMPDVNLPNLMNGVKGLVNAYGGWKDYYLTEGGWPTATSGYPSVSEEVQRDYIVRAFLNYMVTDQVKAYEYYDYKNDGTDDRYYDIFWGITDNNGRPKLAYAAVNQLMNELDNARYVGTFDAGNPDVAVQVFLNEGKPVIVAWKKVDHKDNPAVKPPTSTVTLPFAATGVSAMDINGVEKPFAIGNGSIDLVVSGSPAYVTGAPADFVFESAANLVQVKKQEAISKLNLARDDSNGELVDEDADEIERISTELVAAATGNVNETASGMEQGIKDVYSLMTRIAGRIEEGAVPAAPGYVALEALYNLAETASVALSYALDGSGANTLNYANAVQAAEAEFNERKGEFSVMPVSASAVLRMNRYGRLAEAAFDRASYGESYAYNLLAREFAATVTAMAESEQAKFIGVMANVNPTQTTGEAGYVNTLTLSLVNSTDVDQPVTARLKLPAGWEASQTKPDVFELTIPADDSSDRLFNVLVPEDTIKGRYDIGIEILHGDEIFETKKVELTVEDGLAVRVLPIKETIDGLDAISVQLTGTSSASKTGEISLKGPDGNPLTPVTTNAFVDLKKGDRVRLDFQWTYHEPAEFNEYNVDLQVVETTSDKIIFHDPELPLDFNLAQSANDVTFDGDLEDWADAYPIHLRRKDQNASGYQDSDNLEAKAYAKWATDGMYFAIAVKDDIHKQSENPANMWKNDSIQVSLDPLNNKEAPYGADDVEWSFALTDNGNAMVNVFNSTPPNPNGDMSGLVPFEAFRDEANKTTVYEFQIPAEYVKDLDPVLDGIIGFNIAVNDADLQNGRDNFIQWTQGTADAKNTSGYDAFTFVDNLVSPPGGETGEEPDGEPDDGDGEDPDDNPDGNPDGTPEDNPEDNLVADDGQNDDGDDDSPSGSGNDQPVSPAETGIVTIPAASLRSGSNGTSTVDAPADTTEVKLPWDTATLLAENNLVVKTDKLALEIPPELFDQLSGLIPAEQLQGSSISLTFKPVQPSEADKWLANGQLSGTEIRLGSEVYELSLTIRTAGGTTEKLTRFNQPITIRVRLDPSMDPDLTGIYYISDDGKPEWIGGQYAEGEMTAQIRHFSKYAALEVKKDFSDLAAGHWAYDAIRQLAAKQIVLGTGFATFEPGRSVTRAEFTSMLVQALKLTEPGETAFADVSEDKWYAEAVSIAHAAGIVAGKSATSFDPEGLLTREEMATLTMKAYHSVDGKAPTGTAVSFSDESKISPWASVYAKEASSLAFIQGRAGGVFAPKGITTRAEAAQVIYGLMRSAQPTI